jgi:NAD(P)-dependent dehydrogenase (short-subunit alcohol dehydrogenase family)
VSAEFVGRRAFVTGGTSGIGAATAVLLAELGAEVTALGPPPADPADLPDHPRVRVVEHDVLDRAGLTGLLSTGRPLHALVNCAGVSHDREEYDLAGSASSRSTSPPPWPPARLPTRHWPRAAAPS